MKITLAIALTASALLIAACAEKTGDQDAESTTAGTETQVSGLNTFEQRFSYALGSDLGNQFKRGELAIDVDALALALRDVQAGNTLQMTEEDMRSTMQMAQEKQQAKQQADKAAQTEANKTEGDAFLAANAAKDGVITLDSGLSFHHL